MNLENKLVKGLVNTGLAIGIAISLGACANSYSPSIESNQVRSGYLGIVSRDYMAKMCETNKTLKNKYHDINTCVNKVDNYLSTKYNTVREVFNYNNKTGIFNGEIPVIPGLNSKNPFMRKVSEDKLKEITRVIPSNVLMAYKTKMVEHMTQGKINENFYSALKKDAIAIAIDSFLIGYSGGSSSSSSSTTNSSGTTVGVPSSGSNTVWSPIRF